jgi:CubicO group peptidase (beta-lactamase class C family)
MSVADGAEPMQLNTTMALASATKLITSIAVLQVVEQGLIALDDDITKLIPLLGEQEILDGVDESGAPKTKKRQNPITLR